MSNFSQNRIAMDKSEIQRLYKRQLELVDINQELTRDIEFRDYRIQKLEKELREMQVKFAELSALTKLTELAQIKTSKIEQREMKLTQGGTSIYG